MKNKKILIEFDENIVINKSTLNFDKLEMKTLSNDAQFIFELDRMETDFYIEVEITTNEMSSSPINLYYASKTNDNQLNFYPQHSFSIGETNNGSIKQIINLSEPCNVLRIDPCESICEITKIRIHVTSINNVNDCINMLNHFTQAKKDGIVLVTHDMSRTGAPILLLEVARELKSMGKNIFVLAENGGDLEKEFIEYEIPFFNIKNLFDELHLKENKRLYIDNLIAAFYAMGFQKVILNTIITGNLVECFSLSEFKIVSLIHEMKNSIQYYHFGHYGKALANLCHYLIFPAEIVEQEFIELFDEPKGKVVVKPQGYFQSNSTCQLSSNEAKYIVGLGTLSLRKGTDLFFQAAIQLAERYDNIKFIWMGDCADQELLSWLTYQANKSNSNLEIEVVAMKKKEEYLHILQNSFALWLTSREDPFPSVMIDAIKNNVPVFAFSNTGGCNTVLANGRGILIDNFDCHELATKTLEVLNNDQEKVAMVKKAKQYVDEQLNFKNYVEFIDSL